MCYNGDEKSFEQILKDTLKDFAISDDGTYCGFCDSEEELKRLTNNLKCIGYSYSVRSSKYRQKTSDATTSNPRIFFQHFRGNIDIPFIGYPFSVEYSSYQECTLGPKYYNKKEIVVPSHLADHVNPAKKRLLIMDTKKSDCPATFSIKCVKVYLGYSVQSINDREIKKKVVHSLKEALETVNKPESVLRFYVRASPPDHHIHSTESVKASGDIHPSLAEEIVKVVEAGTTSVRVIKLHLERFVNITFTGPNTPDNINTMFYPTHQTIYSHVYRALMKLKRSVFDQDALQMQINEWQKECRGDNIFFRPFSDANEEIQPLLLCYQSTWQKDMLTKYGDVCLLDATYKTTKYDIPLFFVTVKANRCCLVVGFFFIQVEDTRSIAEALHVFKRWNTDFNPAYWVTDFSESEIAAIRETFPSSKVYLCSFHREQAWERWVKKGGNLTVRTDKEPVLELWRYVAASPSEEQFRVNVEMLQTHEVFHRNPKALLYFKNQWLSVAEKWVRAFENTGIFANIRTTNGAETMNKKVKKSFLSYDTDKTLTGVVKVLVNSFIPSLIRKYCRMNSVIKKTNEVLPAFLHGKTQEFVAHVWKRYCSAESFSKESVSMIGEGVFSVKSDSSKDVNYTVNFAEPSCTCEDYQKYKYTCKHFCAVFILYPEWGFDRLNEKYRNSPLICLDKTYGYGASGSCIAQTDSVIHELEDTSSDETMDEEDYIPEESASSSSSSSSSSLFQEARERCRNIINLTYNCDNDTIKRMLEALKNVEHIGRLSNPAENGLPLAVTSSKM